MGPAQSTGCRHPLLPPSLHTGASSNVGASTVSGREPQHMSHTTFSGAHGGPDLVTENPVPAPSVSRGLANARRGGD